MKHLCSITIAFLLLLHINLITSDDNLLSEEDIPEYLQLVHPDVHLNPYSIFADEVVWQSRLGQQVEQQVVDLKTFLMWALPTLTTQVGRTKVEALSSLNEQYINYLVSDRTELPANYSFFGPDSLQNIGEDTLADVKEVVALLFQTNAFYASALTADESGNLTIRSYDGDSFFARINRAVSTTAYRFVDADLDENFEIVSFQVYSIENGEKVYNDSATELEAYEILIVHLNYYSECLHTTLHSFQYIMGSALAHAADINVAANAFAQPYVANLLTTYEAVVNLDLKVDGVLVGAIFQSNRTEILSVLRDVLAKWGSFKSADEFVDDFLFAGFPDKDLPETLDLLTQFQKHAEVIDSFAEEVDTYVASNERYQLTRLNHRLRSFLLGTGENLSRISNLEEWLALMSVTGLMHGQTLSFTRLMVTKVAFTEISPDDDFGAFDLAYWRSAAPTIIGAQPGRFLFNSTTFSSETPYFDPELVAVISKFTDQVTALKQAYYEEVEAEGDIAKHGWILADFFPDGFDGRQLTITTYL